jgi:hypothetical protein
MWLRTELHQVAQCTVDLSVNFSLDRLALIFRRGSLVIVYLSSMYSDFSIISMYSDMIKCCSVKLEDVQVQKDHLIVHVREDGLQAITIYNLPPVGEPINSLSSGRKLEFPEPSYSLEHEDVQFESHIFGYGYSSLKTPPSVFHHDMNTGKTVLKKVKPVSIS